MKIGTIYQGVQVSEFSVKREGKQYSVRFEFNSTQGTFKVNLGGVRDTDNLCELLEAERLWVEEEIGSEIEYGRYTLGMSHESYSEILFDSLA